MRIIWSTVAVALLANLATPSPARAGQIVYSTLGPGDSYSAGPFYVVDGSADYQAFLFQPTASGLLESITVALARQTELTQETRFILYEGTITTIGNPLEDFFVPNLAPAPGVLVTISSLLHPALMAGGSYWLSMVDPGKPDGSESMWAFNNQHVRTQRIVSGLSDPNAFAPAYEVTLAGGVNGGGGGETPEPGTWALVACGIAGACWRQWKRVSG